MKTSVVCCASVTTNGPSDKGAAATVQNVKAAMSDSQLTIAARLAERLDALKERL